MAIVVGVVLVVVPCGVPLPILLYLWGGVSLQGS
jgi:hypothetical protein